MSTRIQDMPCAEFARRSLVSYRHDMGARPLEPEPFRRTYDLFDRELPYTWDDFWSAVQAADTGPRPTHSYRDIVDLAVSLTDVQWRDVLSTAGIAGCGGDRHKNEPLCRRMAAWVCSTFSGPHRKRAGYWSGFESYHLDSAKRSRENAAKARAGEHVSLYVSDSDLYRAQTPTKAEYHDLQAAAEEARARALAQLPSPEQTMHHEPQAVVDYLQAGEVLTRWCGASTCRVCGVTNGSMCLTDGTWAWPSGYAHYVEVHQVRIPDGFREHMARQGAFE